MNTPQTHKYPTSSGWHPQFNQRFAKYSMASGFGLMGIGGLMTQHITTARIAMPLAIIGNAILTFGALVRLS